MGENETAIVATEAKGGKPEGGIWSLNDIETIDTLYVVV